jgi:hypothetical protein
MKELDIKERLDGIDVKSLLLACSTPKISARDMPTHADRFTPPRCLIRVLSGSVRRFRSTWPYDISVICVSI